MERGPSFNSLSSRALRHLQSNQASVEDNPRQLPAGLPIESSADDSTDLSIPERMRARHGSLEFAQRNLADGVSLLRTAETSLSEVSQILGQMRELTVAALGGTAKRTDLRSLQTEFRALAQEVRQQMQSSTYGGRRIFDGDRSVQIQAGAAEGNRIDLRLSNLAGVALVLQLLDLRTNTTGALDQIDFYSELIATRRAELESQEHRLGDAMRSLGNSRMPSSGAQGRIQDMCNARSTAKVLGEQIQRDAALNPLVRAQAQPLGILQLLEGAATEEQAGEPSTGISD